MHKTTSLKVLWRGVVAGCLHDLVLRLIMPRVCVALETVLDAIAGPYDQSKQVTEVCTGNMAK